MSVCQLLGAPLKSLDLSENVQSMKDQNKPTSLQVQSTNEKDEESRLKEKNVELSKTKQLVNEKDAEINKQTTHIKKLQNEKNAEKTQKEIVTKQNNSLVDKINSYKFTIMGVSGFMVLFLVLLIFLVWDKFIRQKTKCANANVRKNVLNTGNAQF